MALVCIGFRQEIIFHWASCLVMIISISKIWLSFGEDPSLHPAEADAIYKILHGINHEIEWKSIYPGNLCTDGPHGLNCDIYENTWHVVELNLGWVSSYVNNPPCSANATIDPSIFDLPHLKKLFIYQCFTKEPREVPSEIWKLAPSLQHLTFQSNSALVGKFPPEIGNLTNLDRLVLSDNNLTGDIPVQIGNLINLQELLLSHNDFNGLIPDSLQNLHSLKVLDLSGNQLTGAIPSSIGKLKSLQKLDLSGNRLSGNIPYQLGNLENLQFLDLSSNSLNGSIPDHLHKLNRLQYLFLENNLLGGSLPGFWGNLSSLIEIMLSHSFYEGNIPDSLGLLQHLNSLALNNNKLVGKIPPLLGSLGSLYYMNLSFNFLAGPIPFSSSFMHRLGKNLNMRNNSGLCYGYSSGMADHLVRCDSQISSTPGGYLETHKVSSHAARQRISEAISVLYITISLCLSMAWWLLFIY